MNTQARAQAILTSPKTEWNVIAAESTDVSAIYRNYIVILAAIPAVCSVIGLVIFGYPIVGRPGLMSAIRVGVGTYVASLVVPLVAAFVIDQLAPKFRSSGGLVQALKMVAFASTPVWVAGVVNLVPAFAPLGLVAALYAVYLFHLGLSPVMKTPVEQVIPFMAVAALTIIVVNIVLTFLMSMLGIRSYGF